MINAISYFLILYFLYLFLGFWHVLYFFHGKKTFEYFDVANVIKV